jgi:hypothetical protein
MLMLGRRFMIFGGKNQGDTLFLLSIALLIAFFENKIGGSILDVQDATGKCFLVLELISHN